MATTLVSLRRQIARLEKEHPDSRLLQDLKNQLRGSQDALGASAAQVWHSGNPVVPGSATPLSTSDPMQQAIDGLETLVAPGLGPLVHHRHAGAHRGELGCRRHDVDPTGAQPPANVVCPSDLLVDLAREVRAG